MVAKTARATYADLEALPAHRVGEILFGVLHSHPRPALPHAHVASAMGGELFKSSGWIILDEPELHLGSEPDVVVPDLAGWRRTRLAHTPDAGFMTLARLDLRSDLALDGSDRP